MPLAAATPRLTVQYGTFTIDQTNGCILSSEYDSEDTSQLGSFSIQFHVRTSATSGTEAGDDTAIAALVAAVETNLRIPRQRLLVKLGNAIVRDWDFSPAGLDDKTAILIEPELRLLEQNGSDYHYAFRVKCQFPGNVPGNFWRRESLTQVGESLRDRRVVTIGATWTGSTGKTAYQNYLDQGDTFFTGRLPVNSTDQYATSGTWVKADETPGAGYNDENSLVAVTRTYWEVFAGRRESQTVSIETIADRRVVTIPSTWTSTPGFTALENYNDNGGAFFTAVLPTNVTSGSWVLADERFGYNDQNGILTATRVYHEVVNGLREYRVQVTADAANLRTVVVSGVYYSTGVSAKTNYTNNINTLIAGALGSEGITRYESHSVPKVTGYDTTGKRYFFTWTIHEIAYPQSSSVDDVNVTFELLDVRVLKPFDPQAVPASVTVTRLKTVVATFVAAIDYQANQDPVGLWVSGLRAHVVGAVTSKLGADVTTVEVVEEEVGASLDGNKLIGNLRLVVTGGGVLSMRIVQKITQAPGRDFVGRGDGTPWSYHAYRALPEKLLYREAVYEYVVGTSAPDPFGDATVSGFGIVATGKTAQASIDDQNAAGALLLNAWFIDRRASEPYSETDVPTDRGDDGALPFQTIVHRQVENWRYCEALE